MVSILEPFPADIDELAHYSYIRHAYENKLLITDYYASYLLREDDLESWSEKNNYLNHPSLYYLFLGNVLNISGEDPGREIEILRASNLLISSLAIAILLWVGFSVFRTVCPFFVYAAAVTLIPKLGIVGGIINNDNQALLGSALVFLGLVHALNRRITFGTSLITGAGFCLSALAKLTAGLSMGLLIVLVHLFNISEFHVLIRDKMIYLFSLLILLLLGIAPYMVNLYRLGSPLYINSTAYAEPYSNYHLNLDLYGFIGHFFSRMVIKWAAYEPSNIYQIISLFCLLLLAALGLWRLSAGDKSPSTMRILVFGAFLATGCVMVAHVYHLYSMYLSTGHLGGATIRYYIPIWPAVALAAGFGIGVIKIDRIRIYTIMLLFALLISSTAPFAIAWHYLAK